MHIIKDYLVTIILLSVALLIVATARTPSLYTEKYTEKYIESKKKHPLRDKVNYDKLGMENYIW